MNRHDLDRVRPRGDVRERRVQRRDRAIKRFKEKYEQKYREAFDALVWRNADLLYAFKQAGVSVQGDMFRRGVDNLLQTQINEPTDANGSSSTSNSGSTARARARARRCRMPLL